MTIEEIRLKYPKETEGKTDAQIEKCEQSADLLVDIFMKHVQTIDNHYENN